MRYLYNIKAILPLYYSKKLLAKDTFWYTLIFIFIDKRDLQ